MLPPNYLILPSPNSLQIYSGLNNSNGYLSSQITKLDVHTSQQQLFQNHINNLMTGQLTKDEFRTSLSYDGYGNTSNSSDYSRNNHQKSNNNQDHYHHKQNQNKQK